MTDLENSGELQAIRQEVDEKVRHGLRRGAYFWAIMVATVIMAAGSSILISVKLNRQNDRKLCAVVITSDDNYHKVPPTSPLGIAQAANFSQLRRDLGCRPYQGD